MPQMIIHNAIGISARVVPAVGRTKLRRTKLRRDLSVRELACISLKGRIFLYTGTPKLDMPGYPRHGPGAAS